MFVLILMQRLVTSSLFTTEFECVYFISSKAGYAFLPVDVYSVLFFHGN